MAKIFNIQVKKRIVFFSHAVTLAHLGRPLSWIESLNPNDYEVILCSDISQKKLVEEKKISFVECPGIDPKVFLERLGRGLPIYSGAVFHSHVLKDLEILNFYKPDLVIGDFRHSLSVSCRVAKIKYVNITNAYWSQNILLEFPLPDSPIVNFLGLRIANLFWKSFSRQILFCVFFHMVWVLRKSLKLIELKFQDYREIMIDGDWVAFSDIPELVPLKKLKSNQFYVGPNSWVMTTALPGWWSKMDARRPKVFVALGSSGDLRILPTLIDCLLKFDFDILLATSGRAMDIPKDPRIFVSDFLPLEQACSISQFIVCNGGSPTVNAALNFGKPMIGITSNNDQVLNMSHASKVEAGIHIRHSRFSTIEFNLALHKIVDDPKYSQNANRFQKIIKEIDFSQRVRELVRRAMTDSPVGR